MRRLWRNSAYCYASAMHQVFIQTLHHKALALFCVLFLAGCGESERTLAIATGGPAGLYYPFGGAMASLWSEVLPGVNAKAEVTGGWVSKGVRVAQQESE